MPLVLLLACGGSGDATLEDLRAEARRTCRAACAHQADGSGCDRDAFLDPCRSDCDDLADLEDGPSCLEAWSDLHRCWLDLDWVCDGSVVYDGVAQPVPVDDRACDAAYDAWRAACS